MLLTTLGVSRLAAIYFAINSNMWLTNKQIWHACHPEGTLKNWAGGSDAGISVLISKVRLMLPGEIYYRTNPTRRMYVPKEIQ